MFKYTKFIIQDELRNTLDRVNDHTKSIYYAWERDGGTYDLYEDERDTTYYLQRLREALWELEGAEKHIELAKSFVNVVKAIKEA